MGNVSAIGAGVKSFREGDRVAVGIASACGACPTCLRGDAAHCETAFLGAAGIGPLASPHGGFARSIGIDASRIYGVSDALSDLQAGMLEPLAVAVHALRRTPVLLGDRAVVLGAGPIGCLVLQCAKAAGAGPLVVVDFQESRRALALELGADHAIDPRQDDLGRMVSELLGGPPDLVLECAGVPSTIDQSVELVRRGGVVSIVGLSNVPAQINPVNWLIKEVRVLSSMAYQHEEFEVAQGLVQDGRVRLEALHTRTIALAELDTCFAELVASPTDMKVLVDPNL